MPARIPPGRAGRLWLLRRLEAAQRGVEVLDQKRQTLLGARQQLTVRLAAAKEEWDARAGAAAAWNARSSAIAGQRLLRLAALHRAAQADIRVTRRNVVGAVVPAEATVEPGSAPDFVALGGASVALAARAHTEALAAAAEYAAVRAAHNAIEAELAATTRRLRAIERRWIPQHEAALRRLELALDESELADIVRARWASERQ
ncbi:MAG TPA: V-type ATP synthase subunit D [Gaiellaceae bacterium]|nr:V-type ATP synthase subunit D [Gaiellaceae bacterium]